MMWKRRGGRGAGGGRVIVCSRVPALPPLSNNLNGIVGARESSIPNSSQRLRQPLNS